ncbi:MAG TPA: DUF2117 domain-containing protein [Methanoregulaceae archaeon]|nr:DUF2117 domain-containing protein [Methanoregulaceae archaeon]
MSTPSDPCILVLHGPEVFDAGDVPYLIDRLNPERIIVAGVMARTAAEESGIRCEFISVPPSLVLKDISGCALLANHGKTPESGRIFGEIVASRLLPRGLIQIECSDKTLFAWNMAVDNLVQDIGEKTGFRVVSKRTSKNAPSPKRSIRGCIRGEPVYVNGVVIGHATGAEVVLKLEEGIIIPESGLIPKMHGLEKIAKIPVSDLSGIWCKSGTIRRNAPVPTNLGQRHYGRVLFIDHAGHHLYRLLTPDVCGIISVGDDTTAVCGHISSHLGIPVFGIIDDDRDGIVEARYVPGSVVARAVSERDDDIGAEIGKMIPTGPVFWNELVSRLILHLGSRVTISRYPG